MTLAIWVLIAVLLGLVAGAVIVYIAPRLVAYRLPEPPEYPTADVLIPLAGGWLTGYRPLRTLAVELATALAAGLLFLHYGIDGRAVLAAVYSTLLILIAHIDIDYRRVLDRLSYPGTFLAILGGALWSGMGIENAAIGAAVGLVLFFVIQVIGRGAMGAGDTKLAMLIGAMRGFPGVFNGLLAGVMLGGLAAAFYLIVLRRGRKEKFAYGPYLAAGAIVSFFLP